MAPLRCMALLSATLMLAACGAPEEVAGEAPTADARTERGAFTVAAHEDAVATVLPAGDGWRVEGLVLDMAGRWELSLGFALEGAEDSALIVLRIP